MHSLTRGRRRKFDVTEGKRMEDSNGIGRESK